MTERTTKVQVSVDLLKGWMKGEDQQQQIYTQGDQEEEKE